MTSPKDSVRSQSLDGKLMHCHRRVLIHVTITVIEILENFGGKIYKEIIVNEPENELRQSINLLDQESIFINMKNRTKI